MGCGRISEVGEVATGGHKLVVQGTVGYEWDGAGVAKVMRLASQPAGESHQQGVQASLPYPVP